MLRVLAAIALLFVVGCAAETEAPATDEAAVRALLDLPDGLPAPWIPAENPLTAEKIELGRRLFFDPDLSANQTQSCGSCHAQALAFADGERTPIGSTGQRLVRNSMGLANVAWFSTLTWASDGLLSLEEQIQVPLRSDNPVELGVTDGARDAVLARFADDPTYARLFAEAFPDSPSGPTINKIVFALASYCRSLVSIRSPYDRYVAGDDEALTEQQRWGLALFNGERFECFHCHGGVFFTSAYRDSNTPEGSVRYPFFNNGLYDVDGQGSYPAHDQGLFELTSDPADRGLFRPPSLRNIALTAPYMHDGSIETLREVVEHYAAGGRVIDDGPFAGDGRLSPLKSGLVRGFAAHPDEIDALVAFLEALTDPGFLDAPGLGDPFATAAP